MARVVPVVALAFLAVVLTGCGGGWADGASGRGKKHSKKEYEKALAEYTEAVRLDPEDADAYNELAWIQATCPKASLRYGPKAVANATKACELTDWEDADYLDTLAAAYAECGDYEDAVKWQKKALRIGFPDKAETRQAEARLQLYTANKPYRDE